MNHKLGCLHIYTGDGKGKTTAAFGLALRCAGNGHKVEIFQFLKSEVSGEVKALCHVPNIHYNSFFKKHDFYYKLCDSQKQIVQKECEKAFAFVKNLVFEKKCDMIILDEIMATITLKLLPLDEVLSLAKQHPDVEIVMTGRNAPCELMELADYVSDIKMAKHPYEKGICARRGIEF